MSVYTKQAVEWKVMPEPTGRYRSFDRRGWPNAYYPDGTPAIYLDVPDTAYVPRNVKEGATYRFRIRLADHTPPKPGGAAFVWVGFITKHEITLDAAKALAEEMLADRPGFAPKGA